MNDAMHADDMALAKELGLEQPDAAQQPGAEPSEPAQQQQSDAEAGAEAQNASSNEGDRREEADERRGDPTIALQQARQQAREERESRRKLQSQLDAVNANMQVITDRFAQIAQRQGQQPGQQPGDVNLDPATVLEQPIPDVFEDPEGHAKAVNAQRQVLQQIAQRDREAQMRQMQAAQQQQAFNQLAATGKQHMEDFMIATPDYLDAEKFLIEGRRNEYAQLGYNDAQINHAIQQEYLGFIDHALRTNQNAAELAYNIAKTRGYQPGRTPASAQQPQKDPAQQIAEKAELAAQTKSLGQAKGQPSKGGVNADRIAAMTPKELEAMDDHTFLSALGLA